MKLFTGIINQDRIYITLYKIHSFTTFLFKFNSVETCMSLQCSVGDIRFIPQNVPYPLTNNNAICNIKIAVAQGVTGYLCL